MFVMTASGQELKPIDLTADSKIRRIRGIAFSARVSAQVANRLVDSAKGVLVKFAGDTFIYTDHQTGPKAGM